MYQVWLKSFDIYLTYRSETKIWACLGQITPPKFDEICPVAIPNQISTKSMHIPSLEKIHWCLLKLSSGNEIHTDGHTDVQRETIIPRHYCVAGYKNETCTCIRIFIVWLSLQSTMWVTIEKGAAFPSRLHVRPAKTQINLRSETFWILGYPQGALRRLSRLPGCAGWSKSSLGAHAILYAGNAVSRLNYIWITHAFSPNFHPIGRQASDIAPNWKTNLFKEVKYRTNKETCD